jgi:hypothetical protein
MTHDIASSVASSARLSRAAKSCLRSASVRAGFVGGVRAEIICVAIFKVPFECGQNRAGVISIGAIRALVDLNITHFFNVKYCGIFLTKRQIHFRLFA